MLNPPIDITLPKDTNLSSQNSLFLGLDLVNNLSILSMSSTTLKCPIYFSVFLLKIKIVHDKYSNAQSKYLIHGFFGMVWG